MTDQDEGHQSSVDHIMRAVQATCDDGDWNYPDALMEWLEEKAKDAD